MEFSAQQNMCTQQTSSSWAEEEERFVMHCQESIDQSFKVIQAGCS